MLILLFIYLQAAFLCYVILWGIIDVEFQESGISYIYCGTNITPDYWKSLYPSTTIPSDPIIIILNFRTFICQKFEINALIGYMTQVITKDQHSRTVPFFLRVVAILILVTGVLGLLFYVTVTIYQVAGRNFLYDFGYKDFDRKGLYIILFLFIALNTGLIISALQLLRLKRAGMYLFGISYIVFALLSYFLQDDLGWFTPGVGLLLFLTVFIHKNKLKY